MNASNSPERPIGASNTAQSAEYGRGTTPRFYVTPEALGSWADYAQRHVSSDDWEGTLARALLTLVSAYQWARDWPDEQSDGSEGA